MLWDDPFDINNRPSELLVAESVANGVAVCVCTYIAVIKIASSWLLRTPFSDGIDK
jgi:hypothetical protein